MAAEIIIVDDDPMVGALSNDLLTDAGFSTRLINDSTLVVGVLKQEKPKLVLLDILMPGIDGLTLLHTIKNDPALAGTRVAVVSGKSFQAEIDRAKEYGADAFIKKPYEVKTFAKDIIGLIGEPEGPAGEAPEEIEAKKAAQKFPIKVRVWGQSEPDSTPCMTLEALGRLFILDAGKGIVPIGERILSEGKYNEAWLLLTHFHADHVSGLGLFPCLRREGFSLRIAGPREPDKSLAGLLKDRIKESFAVDPTPPKATLHLHELKEDTYALAEGIRVSPFYANHPGTALGYVFELQGRRVVFCPDSEIYGDVGTALQDYDEKIGRLCRGADLLVHDGRYNEADLQNHLNEGHSSFANAARFAAEYEAARLILYHADPSYSDDDIDAMEEAANAILDEEGSVIPCKFARDGLEMDF